LYIIYLFVCFLVLGEVSSAASVMFVFVQTTLCEINLQPMPYTCRLHHCIKLFDTNFAPTHPPHSTLLNTHPRSLHCHTVISDPLVSAVSASVAGPQQQRPCLRGAVQPDRLINSIILLLLPLSIHSLGTPVLTDSHSPVQIIPTTHTHTLSHTTPNIHHD